MAKERESAVVSQNVVLRLTRICGTLQYLVVCQQEDDVWLAVRGRQVGMEHFANQWRRTQRQ